LAQLEALRDALDEELSAMNAQELPSASMQGQRSAA
jgi:hypothetical protein